MKYLAPAMKIEEAQVVNMLAESLKIDSEIKVDGSQGLAKENFAWDIWNNEDYSSRSTSPVN